MRYLRSTDLDLVRRVAAETYSRRRPRRANRPRLYAPWPTIAPVNTIPMGVLNAVREGLEHLVVNA